ncbi:MAG: tRNA(Ile)-lysidine synthase [Gemmatimonadetes bacterium]|nr:tRNA(Ile)-lysidine synthase [Gemmatimonadota bacterium]
MHQDDVRAVREAARRAAEEAGRPLLLAVSGGLDSMVLLHAMAAAAPRHIAAVATFDHGTGAAASQAAGLVLATASRLGLPVVSTRAEQVTMGNGREDGWRTARHHFLRTAALTHGARVVTAHTEDDHIETVLMRVMRGSGARGLAGLYAESPIMRPFVGLRRTMLEGYASATGVDWVEDPSNTSREFLRNRVRHDLLPALRSTDAGVDAWLLDVSERAATLRREIECFVATGLHTHVEAGGRLVVAAAELAGHGPDSLAVLWNALAGRIGLALDARGTRRLAEFTTSRRGSGRMPLAGGWYLEATRTTYILGRIDDSVAPPAILPVRGSLDWGRFRFHVQESMAAGEAGDTGWCASFEVPSGAAIVRRWADGDRLTPAAGQPRRRVKRYLSESGLRGGERSGWPVVVLGDDVVWIPGVRRSDAATDRSGRPVRHYVCERIDR